MPAIPEIDRYLIERFARGNGTVFVGAGVSLASRLPSWKQLIDPLKAALGDEAHHLDFLQIAEFYEMRHGRAALLHYLMDQLSDVRYQLNKTHELLVSLPVQRIFTTNFDDLLEMASQKKLINRQVIHHASQVGLADHSRLSIVKLHGDLKFPESIVITARDFHAYAVKHPAVADLLKVELQTRTVLFIGYSFNDPNLSTILATAAAQSGAIAPALYAIQFRPSELAVDAMKARGVTVIPLDAPSGTDAAQALLEAWLHEFRRQVNSFEPRKQPHEAHRFPGDGVRLARGRSVTNLQVSERLLAGLSSEHCVVVVTGEAGVGKTHVVMEAALSQLQPNNRALWTDGFEQVVWIHRLVRENGSYHTLKRIFNSIISQVDISFSAEDARSERLRPKIATILRERRLLIVIEDLDDPSADAHDPALTPQQAGAAADFERIRQWLDDDCSQAECRSRIIVTSRTAALSGYPVEVKRLGAVDATKMIREYVRALMLRRHVEAPDTEAEANIVRLTRGNPQAIRLALGLINGTRDIAWLDDANRQLAGNHAIEPVLVLLLGRICAAVDSADAAHGGNAARHVIQTMVAFPGEEWVPLMLLADPANGEGGQPDRRALRVCVDIGLLDHDAIHDRFFMHRTIKEVLGRHPWFDAGTLDTARTRLASRLLAFLDQDDVVRRSDIVAPYWNALVRDEMVKVDQHWPIIESMMWWAESRPLIVDFVLLLVHYMDSRFMNVLRVHFVEKALTALAASGRPDDAARRRRTSALLDIDALGWTYMEEGSDELAERHIQRGLDTLAATDQHDDASDLHALACIWRARIQANRDNAREAERQVREAHAHAARCPEKYWIQARVSMIAGDVHLMADHIDEAIDAYQKAEDSEERYGGEVGYQTDPRLGLALLRKADGGRDQATLAAAIGEARQRFNRLAENRHVPTGRLYGEFGQAMLTAREHSTRAGLEQLKKILREIAARQGENNILLKLAAVEYDRLASRQHAPGVTRQSIAH